MMKIAAQYGQGPPATSHRHPQERVQPTAAASFLDTGNSQCTMRAARSIRTWAAKASEASISRSKNN
eukprot:1091751-Heterocapsa_arctica.AAC.1